MSSRGSRIALDYFHDKTEDLPSLELVMGSIAPFGGETSWRRINSKRMGSLLQAWTISDHESLAEKAKRGKIGDLMDYVSVISAAKLE